VTQYFRGEEFVYVDCLLQWGYKKPKEELPFVFKYFGVFFQLYSKFLNLLPDYIQEVRKFLVERGTKCDFK